ncbi:MAG: AAA family ATPase [Planctomycetes bacterium]|nr:AAA family ATPase [Planctomycetota bacterium]
MICPKCQSDNPSEALFCMKCGAKLERKCFHCGTEFPEEALFCMKCGKRLVAEAAPADELQEDVAPEAERRHLTVMFCDMVDSTPLSEKLDPEDLRNVVRAYQETCGKVIRRFEGHIAQHLGDGLLVYFGYPQAHEDDAQRAARAGLGIVEAITRLNPSFHERWGVELAVRVGIHTGLVVAGEVGDGATREHLAMGETPNIAARLQGEANHNSVVVSAATYRLIEGFFACRHLNALVLKGLSRPMDVYQVHQESAARSRLETVAPEELTPLVGREQEIGLLLERWEQAEDGQGQVVLLGGEAGIGKSRLVQMLKEHVAQNPQAWLTPCQCSAYHPNSAFYPIIDLLERVVLQYQKGDDETEKMRRLEGFLVQYGFHLPEIVPVFANLLTVPLGDKYTPSSLSPERQKQQFFQTLIRVLLEIAARQPLLIVMEDLHWADPTTLEFLNLLVDQVPTTRIFALFTFRPEYSPPWSSRAYLTTISLHRLPRKQAANMVQHVVGGKALPDEVIEQVVSKTDGVPLFVEELTKMVRDSGLLIEKEERYELSSPLPPLAIPATLQGSLMARLDRLSSIKEVVQLGATLGREITYEMLRAVSHLEEETLYQGLKELVEAELIYQRGIPPQATYTFKHALIQETAYQSLLRSTRQQYHQRIAEELVRGFPETVAAQPELVAHHFIEAGLVEQAIPYCQQAGQFAVERSANEEAIVHLSRGLELLEQLPVTLGRDQQELSLQMTLGTALIVSKGYTVPKVERTYRRALELCREIGATPQVPPLLYALGRHYYLFRAEYQTTHEIGEQLHSMAQKENDPSILMMAHTVIGSVSYWFGKFAATREHVEQGLALFDSCGQEACDFRYAQDIRIVCLAYRVWSLWHLGHPDLALKALSEMESLSHELSHPPSTALFMVVACWLHYFRREARKAQEHAEALLAFSVEQGFAQWMPYGSLFQGWALVENGEGESKIDQMCQALNEWQAIGIELAHPVFQGFIAEACIKVGHIGKGLEEVDEALKKVEQIGERKNEARLHRLKGELILIQRDSNNQQAENCFLKALEIAREQGAKLPELQAAMSLSRLWKTQGKKEEARHLLSGIYGWFTEGFDTADLKDAKALLEELS